MGASRAQIVLVLAVETALLRVVTEVRKALSGPGLEISLPLPVVTTFRSKGDMLDTIKSLKDTFTNSQIQEFREKLGEDGWGLFKFMLDSQTEEQAVERSVAFKESVRKLDIQRLLSLHKLLNDEQKKMVQDLL